MRHSICSWYARQLRAWHLLPLLLISCGYCTTAWSANTNQPSATGLTLKPASQTLWVDGLKSIAIGSLALAVAAGSLFWLRRRFTEDNKMNQSMSTPILKSSRRVSQKTLLLVVQWEGKVYLLAEQGSTTQVLDSRALTAEPL